MVKWVALSGCVGLAGISLHAFESRTDIDFTTGYRNDSLQRKNKLELHPPEVAQTDKIDISDISIWQVGIDGYCLISPCSPLHNFYLTGYAYWGWNICDAHLHETIRSDFVKQKGRANIDDIHTYDYQIGVGYLLDWNCWNLGVAGGYAYDEQKIRSKHGSISLPAGAPFEAAPLYGEGYTTRTAWKGPWVGVDLAYNWCHWKGTAGYEYHFGRYVANHSIPGGAIAPIEGYATHTKARAQGNVFYLKGAYMFCSRWELGGGLKYQHWRSHHGHLTSPFFAANGFPATTKVLATGKWISYSIDFLIGYSF